MIAIKQLPSEVAILMTAGDGWSIQLDTDVDLTDYTFEAEVDDSRFPALTVAPVDLAAGKIALVIPPGLPATNSRWHLTWTPAGGVPRTAYGGPFIMRRR